MLYILAFFLPPIAVLLAGKPGKALLNLLLCLCFWIPGIIHALLVIHDAKADKRTKQIIRAMRK